MILTVLALAGFSCGRRAEPQQEERREEPAAAEQEDEPSLSSERITTLGEEDLYIKLQTDLLCVGLPLETKEVLSTEEHNRLFGLLDKYGLSSRDEYKMLLEKYGGNQEVVNKAVKRAIDLCPEVFFHEAD